MSQYNQKIDLKKFDFIPTLDELDIQINWGDKCIGNIRFRMIGMTPSGLNSFVEGLVK